MAGALWEGKESRKIVSRIVIEGELVLQTPAHFGNGDTDELVDMPLLVDPLDGHTPLLTGSSIAGALRNYLRERERGYFGRDDGNSAGVLLFGALKKSEGKEVQHEEGEQSLLVVEDALGKDYGVEIRAGVVINPKSRTLEQKRLFDIELWQAGTRFPLRFELVVREGDDKEELKRALATALEGFNDGSITLGARKRRGFGEVRVHEWRVKEYDLTNPEGLIDWIKNGAEPLENVEPFADIREALGIDELIPDKRRFFHLEATFSLDGSLLVGSSSGQDDKSPDIVHLHSRQADGSAKPILPGTSVAGALRARALKIANTLANGRCGQKLIDEIFGNSNDGEAGAKSSRVAIWETVIENGKTDLVQFRVSIDRFTGGARETALFNEQPVFGGDDTLLKLKLRLLNPRPHEIGLLLLLLKDLWTGDLPLGGEAGVGRGRLKGKIAKLVLRKDCQIKEWEIRTEGQDLIIDGDKNELEDFVHTLNKRIKEGCYETKD